MPKFPAPFNAALGDFDYRSVYATPGACARALWEWPRPEDVENDFETVCAHAEIDPDVYDKLWDWTIEQTHLSDDVKLLLFDTLVRKKPRKGKAATAARNAKLKFIANVLFKHYGLKRTQNDASNGVTAATVLADLPGMPTHMTIENILNG